MDRQSRARCVIREAGRQAGKDQVTGRHHTHTRHDTTSTTILVDSAMVARAPDRRATWATRAGRLTNRWMGDHCMHANVAADSKSRQEPLVATNTNPCMHNLHNSTTCTACAPYVHRVTLQHYTSQSHTLHVQLHTQGRHYHNMSRQEQQRRAAEMMCRRGGVFVC